MTTDLYDDAEACRLLHGDVVDQLTALLDAGLAGSVDLVVADPPYFIGKAVWDERRPDHEATVFHSAWLELCQQLLTPDGALWVCGGLTSVFSPARAMQDLGFGLRSSIIWQKPNPTPLRSRSRFKPAHEQLVWATRSTTSKPHFDIAYTLQANGGLSAMGTVWRIPPAKPWEKRHGRHPTQKPEALLERVVRATCPQGGLALDPFVGSGTTAVVAVRHGRRVIGIDQDHHYLAIARQRVDDELRQQQLANTLADDAEAA